MGWIPPPQIAQDKPTYIHMYHKIVSTHRRDPLASASAVTMLVAPNVDALCASRMLATLFKQDDVGYLIIPVSGMFELQNVLEDLEKNKDLHTVIMIDMGGSYDLADDDWFGRFDLKVTVHVIDSVRPLSLNTLFKASVDRIAVWHDENCDEQLKAEKKSWMALEYEPEHFEEGDDEDDIDGEEAIGEEESDEDDMDRREGIGEEELHSEDDASNPDMTTSRKRRKGTPTASRKRQRTNDDGVRIGHTPLSGEDIEAHQAKIRKYFNSGTFYGQGTANTIYILATQLERVDNDLLWLSILGLTFQYTASRISMETYKAYGQIYQDEVSRLNPQPSQNDHNHSLLSINPDDSSVRSTDELRFMLFRHWTLYDAMYHSSYVAGKLGIWKEKGRSRLTGLLAKMGLSIQQAQQPYSHMDMDLKKNLIDSLTEITPEYGLVELKYPSFMRCYGFHSQPLSAADAVEGISALLDVAEGIRMEVEIEGMRNGGEWFGAGRVWEAHSSEKSNGTRNAEANEPANKTTSAVNGERQDPNDGRPKEPDWWVKNFWTAYDALSDISSLRKSLYLAMSVHRAIIRTGTSIIDKQDIRTMRQHRVVILTQGPDLALFAHPGLLRRLALWLIDALRDRTASSQDVPRSKKRNLPVILACAKEPEGLFTVVGVSASLDYGEVNKNQFSIAFREAIEQCHLVVEFGSFDSSIVEIEKDDLKVFLKAVCAT